MKSLGYAGLVPFVGLAAMTALAKDTETARMLAQYNLIYGVCIVSFLGAVHWGIALAMSTQDPPAYLAGLEPAQFETRSFVWGVTPSLLAWVVASFAPLHYSLWALAAVLGLAWAIDRATLKPMKAFDEYLRLRNHLTLGASAGLVVTACFA